MDSTVSKYFVLSEEQKAKIALMQDVYAFWNSKINLISRRDFASFYERHVLHSLAICHLFPFKDDTHIMDLGTGGGFPGVPLAIMFPNVRFKLVDSISKKTTALKAIVRDLQLPNVIVINQRAEEIEGVFDFIVTRAVAKLEKLYI